MNNERAQRAQDCLKAAKLLYSRFMVNAYEGNVSMRVGEAVYVTPSAICKGFLRPEQVAVVDLAGRTLHAEGVKPSSEVKMHLAAYRARPDVMGVTHAHSPFSTAFAVAGREIATAGYPEMRVLYHKIPLAPYGRPSTDEIWKGTVDLLEDYDCMLLENHGVLTVGKDVWEAYFRLESVESIAKVLYLNETLGGPKNLPEAELAELAKMHAATRARTPVKR